MNASTRNSFGMDQAVDFECAIQQLFAVSLSTAIASILTHGVMLRSVCKRCDWMNTRYYAIISLSVGDMLLLLIPFFALPSLSKPYSEATCINLIKVTDIIITTGMALSTSSVIFLTMHRYIYCLYPFNSARILCRKNVLIAIAIIWIFCLSLSIGNACSELHQQSARHLLGLRLFGSINHLVIVGIGTCIIIFVQSRLMYVTLKKLSREHLQRRVIILQLQASVADSIKRLHNRNRCRKLLPLFVIMLAYIALLVPFPIAWLLTTIGYDAEQRGIQDACMNNLPFLTSAVNPLIYGLTIYEVRRGVYKELRDIYRRLCRGRINAVHPDCSVTSKRTSRIAHFQSDY